MANVEFKYDEIADILTFKSDGMNRKTEVKDIGNMTQLHFDRFTNKMI